MKITVCLKVYKYIDLDLPENVVNDISTDDIDIDSIPEIKQIIEDQEECTNTKICNIFCEEKDQYIFE